MKNYVGKYNHNWTPVTEWGEYTDRYFDTRFDTTTIERSFYVSNFFKWKKIRFVQYPGESKIDVQYHEGYKSHLSTLIERAFMKDRKNLLDVLILKFSSFLFNFSISDDEKLTAKQIYTKYDYMITLHPDKTYPIDPWENYHKTGSTTE